MSKIAAVIATVSVTVLLGLTLLASTDAGSEPSELTVHEWGTFTSVAGPEGQAMQWLPLSGPSDLPCFVQVYQNLILKSFYAPGTSSTPPLTQTNRLDYLQARSRLLGSIRMETPVLYFYSPREEKVDVRVAFPQGFVTEWYPQADVKQKVVTTGALDKTPNTGASILWKDVTVRPAVVGYLQREDTPSHYYAARETDAAPLRVNGKYEKFLFYRGVGGFPVPLNVTVTDTGRIRMKHLHGKPSVILFESRGGKMGFRVVDTRANEAVVDLPELNADFNGLRQELESVLVNEGLFPREAQAMIETWRDSWFEEGTRVFYIVPPQMVDSILPLTINPRPVTVTRVFVGRVEVITPETIQAVERAIAANDPRIVETYGRFLGPIAERIPQSNRVDSLLDGAFANYLNSASRCSN